MCVAQNVKFIAVKLQSTYDALEVKDSLALYWIQDTQRIYKGSTLFGAGTIATEKAAGLLSADDYAALQSLIAGKTVVGGVSGLTAVDGTIQIAEYDDGIKDIGVAISAEPGNALTKMADGLYVGTSTSGNYAAGSGLQMVDGTFSVKIAEASHGLVAVDGALTINLATKDSDGAMSKEDKAFIDELKELNLAVEYATKADVQEVKASVSQIEQSYVWAEM